MNRPYRAYKHLLTDRFGGRVQKISVDAGFTCPNRDGSKGSGGCSYCNNLSFVPPYCKPGMTIAEQVAAGVEYLGNRYRVDQFIVYFQAYSNTYAPLAHLQHLYEQALAHPSVRGLAIGTRPDCIDHEKLDYIQSLAERHYISIEYGLESPNDAVLSRLNRAHTFEEWVSAVEMTAGRGIEICSHLILGLPGESRAAMLDAASIISRYPIDSLKLHHLHVVEKTALAAQYRRDPFPLFSYADYLETVVEFLRRLRPDIYLQRLVGQTLPEQLIGPRWGVRAGAVQQRIEQMMIARNVRQGDKWVCDEKAAS